LGLYLAIAYSKAENREEELAALVKATEIDSGCVEAWQSLAAIYFRRCQYALGIEAQTAVVALKPDDILAQKKLSHMLTTVYALEHPDFEPEELITDEAKKFYGIGKSYVSKGELDEALEAFNNAIQASPDETKARSGLLQSLIHEATGAFHRESFERAIILLKIAVTLDQDFANAWNLLSSSYRRAGRNEEALIAARYTSDLIPTDAHAWYKLGKRYATLGQLHDAEQAFNQALQLNENLRAARRELNKLLGKN
jgi:tetratricopeptide (TPR) repeat protein